VTIWGRWAAASIPRSYSDPKTSPKLARLLDLWEAKKAPWLHIFLDIMVLSHALTHPTKWEAPLESHSYYKNQTISYSSCQWECHQMWPCCKFSGAWVFDKEDEANESINSHL
jgi:hypothetical protein